ncbi:class I SAM-dependent methyltransferase [bacterium]|nr:class I SAM-dependent methyltransferase [bacterium]
MRPRLIFGLFLIRFGRFIQSLAVMVMRPDDLVEFSQQNYAGPKNVESWGRKELVDSGLSSDEMALLEKVPIKEGQLLVLCVGGGREAIYLAKMGFSVTGVDFVPGMIKTTIKNAAQRGLRIGGFVQEVSKLEGPEGSFDIVWLSAAMYSCVPTRKRRLEMLKRIRRALRSEGYFLCQFHYGTRNVFSRKVEVARKIFAFLTLGNLWYEKGDMLWGNAEFIHAFSSENELRSEFEEGGFETIHIDISREKVRGGAVLKKL